MSKIVTYLIIAFIVGSVFYTISKYGISFGTIVPLIITIGVAAAIIRAILTND